MRSPTSEHNSNRQPRVLCRWIEQLLRKEHTILLCCFGDGKGQKKGRAARPQTPRSKRSDGSTAGVCRHPLHYPDRLAPSVKKISVPYQSYHQTEISALSHHAVWKIYSCCVKICVVSREDRFTESRNPCTINISRASEGKHICRTAVGVRTVLARVITSSNHDDTP